MKIGDIREQTTQELSVMEGDLRRQLWKAQFDNHTNQLDDTSSIQKLRRDLARVKTILTERSSGVDAAGDGQGPSDAKQTGTPGASKASRTKKGKE